MRDEPGSLTSRHAGPSNRATAGNAELTFHAKTAVILSDDLVAAVLRVAETKEAHRVGLLLDQNIAGQETLRRLIDALRSKFDVVLETRVAVEPTTDRVDEIASVFRAKPLDLMIGVGGGSTLDLAKALSVMARTDAPVTEYHGTGKPLPPGVTKIMIPTTAGTGSEVTPGAVLVNPKTFFKRALAGPQICPDYAILHAPLTLSMPNPVTAATGMDALTHSIESYTAQCANRITRMYSREAFALVFNNLPRVLENSSDLEARRNVLLGSCLAGIAISNSNTGACHSIAYPLGIYHEVPHGVAVGLVVPKVVEINIKKGCIQYADLLDLIEGADRSGEPAAKARRFLSLLQNFPALPHLDRSPSKAAISKKDVPFLAERSLDLTSALSNNPVEFTRDNAVEVLEQLT